MAARNVNKNYFVIIVIELTQDLFQLFDRVFSGAPNHGGGGLKGWSRLLVKSLKKFNTNLRAFKTCFDVDQKIGYVGVKGAKKFDYVKSY